MEHKKKEKDLESIDGKRRTERQRERERDAEMPGRFPWCLIVVADLARLRRRHIEREGDILDLVNPTCITCGLLPLFKFQNIYKRIF